MAYKSMTKVQAATDTAWIDDDIVLRKLHCMMEGREIVLMSEFPLALTFIFLPAHGRRLFIDSLSLLLFFNPCLKKRRCYIRSGLFGQYIGVYQDSHTRDHTRYKSSSSKS